MTDQSVKRPPRKPRFRRHEKWVVVRPVRITAREILAPGTIMDPAKYRRHYLTSLWQRGRIGPVGHPWTEYFLGKFQAHAEKEDKPASDSDSKLALRVQAGDGGDDAPELTVEHVGGGWYVVRLGDDELAKVKGVPAANTWLEENGYEPALS